VRSDADLTEWFAARLPRAWFPEPLEVMADRDEVLVVVTLPEPHVAPGVGETESRLAKDRAVQAHRDATRDARMAVAADAELTFGRKVSWGARCGDVTSLFTVANVPVMTRLRMPERLVLDTLIDAGIARSRSEALAWCVRLVGRHEHEWIEHLREAMAEVERLRGLGPQL
jgi:hypothetical protein